MKSLIIYIFVFTFVVFVGVVHQSCNVTTQREGIDSLDTTVSNLETGSYSDTTNVVYTKYNIPLPVELYRFLRSNNSTFNTEILNPPDNARNYNTEVKKSVNLGFYSSALAYCIVFEQNQQGMEYLQTTHRLAKELHIDKGYDNTTIMRGKKNLNSNDSLNKLATTAYWLACNYLETNGKINILPFVIVGSWIESMHLAINTLDMSKNGQEIMNKIAEEEKSLSSLITYLMDIMMDSNTFEMNRDVQDLSIKLEDLKKVYDKLKTNKKGVVITKEQYHEISKLIEQYRGDYIN